MIAQAADIVVVTAVPVADIVDKAVVVPAAGTVVAGTVAEAVVDSNRPAVEKTAYRNSSKTVVPDSFVHHIAGTEIPAA